MLDKLLVTSVADVINNKKDLKGLVVFQDTLYSKKIKLKCSKKQKDE